MVHLCQGGGLYVEDLRMLVAVLCSIIADALLGLVGINDGFSGISAERRDVTQYYLFTNILPPLGIAAYNAGSP